MNDLILGILIGFGSGVPAGIVLADGFNLLRTAIRERKHENEDV